jgi:hypothetical protein
VPLDGGSRVALTTIAQLPCHHETAPPVLLLASALIDLLSSLSPGRVHQPANKMQSAGCLLAAPPPSSQPAAARSAPPPPAARPCTHPQDRGQLCTLRLGSAYSWMYRMSYGKVAHQLGLHKQEAKQLQCHRCPSAIVA